MTARSLRTSTLRPGLLVNLKTSIVGNVQYEKRTIEPDHFVGTKKEDKVRRAKWETVRTIVDPAEYEAAKSARQSARSLIRGVCAVSAFGLLCPEADAEDLEKAISKARDIAGEFNKRAKRSRVYVYVLTGRIAPDDVEAMRAINSEVRELLTDMQQGIKNLDVKAIREAADTARGLGSMLTPEAATRVRSAIEAARGAARKIVKAGEQAAQEIDRRSIRAITEARTAFLDLDDAAEIAAPSVRGRALDLAP
jgi:hypothetical protein